MYLLQLTFSIYRLRKRKVKRKFNKVRISSNKTNNISSKCSILICLYFSAVLVTHAHFHLATMEHSPSINVSLVDGDEVEDHRPLLPSRTLPPTPHCGIHQNIQLPADQRVWLDRTQAMASTPLYNGHLYVRPSPRCKKKADKVKEKRGEKKSGGSKRKATQAEHIGRAKTTGPHTLRERGAAFSDIPASPRASPFKSACRPQRVSAHVSLEMQEHHSLPEIIITNKDEDLPPSQCHQGPSEARGLLPGAEHSPAHGPRPPPGPKGKTGDKDDTYWKSHSIGWRLLHRRALFLRRQRLNDFALAVAIFGVVMMVLETELSWSWYSKVSQNNPGNVQHRAMTMSKSRYPQSSGCYNS